MTTAWKSFATTLAVFIMTVGATPRPTASPAATPVPTPSALPTDNPTVNYLAVVPSWVWILAGIAAVALVGYVLNKIVSRPQIAIVNLREPTDKDLESLRIFYGFWLINGALFMVLSVAVIAVLYKASGNVSAADVIALVTSVTAVVGTLIASFFGVQAAGAGRSQAMDKLPSQNQSGMRAKSDPDTGPAAGNTAVHISGNGFTGATAVNFGKAPGTAFSVVNDGLISVTSPPGPANTTVDVVVVFAGLTPPNMVVGNFTYT